MPETVMLDSSYIKLPHGEEPLPGRPAGKKAVSSCADVDLHQNRHMRRRVMDRCCCPARAASRMPNSWS